MSSGGRARDLRAAGRDILALSMGEPDFDTPASVREAAKRAIDAGETRYTAVDGTPALKKAIKAKFLRDNNLEYSDDEVIATSGGKFLVYSAMMATLRPGDEAVIPAPYWVSYPDIVRLGGGTPVIVPAGAAQGFIPEVDELESAITKKTRWLFLNSPNNPSGAVIPEDRLQAIGEMLERHPHVWVLTDDIYEHISYGDRTATLPTVVPSLKDRTLIVNGASKAYAMTGWRMGFGAGPEPLLRAMRKLAGQATSNPSSVTQAAVAAALEGDHGFLADWVDTFRTRRDIVVRQLNLMEGVTCLEPRGAFYVFPSCRGLLGRSHNGEELETDVDFCSALLEAEGVATVPGTAFGLPGHFRISYATGTDVLEEAMKRIANFVTSLT
ncbi:MAG: pyridoxal phosphate-dependent aminotransferase [Pseudomonadota bacterium]